MTRKEMQMEENAIVEKALSAFNDAHVSLFDCKVKKLRSCSAVVLIHDDYYILRSYNTIVAIIDRKTDTLHDFLRYVYGYTVTSAKHISAFKHDYGNSHYGCQHEYCWRSV